MPDLSDPKQPWWDIFPARLNSVTNTNGTFYYTWAELQPQSNGTYTVRGDARRGNTNFNKMTEVANRNTAPNTNATQDVWVRFKGMQAGQPSYEFHAGGNTNVTASGTINVSQTDNTNLVTTGHVRFNLTGGLVVTNTTNTIANVNTLSASYTQIGVVDLATQTFKGYKTVRETSASAIGVLSVQVDGTYNAPSDQGALSVYFKDGANSAVEHFRLWALPSTTGDDLVSEAKWFTRNSAQRATLRVTSSNSNSSYTGSWTFKPGSADGTATVVISTTNISSAPTCGLTLTAGSNVFGYTLNGTAVSASFADGSEGLGTTANTNRMALNFRAGHAVGVSLPGAPANSSSAGSQGQMHFDTAFLYICVSSNTWRRVALNSF